MKYKIVLCICLLFFSFKILAQEADMKSNHLKYLSFETGANAIIPQITEMDFIRSEAPSYYNQGEPGTNLTGLEWSAFAGAKAGIYSINNKFNFWAGLRFTTMHASLGKSAYFSSNPDFFYLLYKQEGTNTEFLKVKEINQHSSYLGIPLEVNYFPFGPHRFRLGFKIGAEFNFRLQTKTEVNFFNSDMSIYESDIAQMIGNPGSYTAAVFGGFKIQYGNPSKTTVSLEGNLPSYFLTHETKGIISPEAGFGLQLSVQIPLNNSKS
jgi:hypothetical protein